MELKPRYWAIAAALHVLLFALLFISAFFTPKIIELPAMTAVLLPPPPPPPPPPKVEPPKPVPQVEPPKPKPPEPKPEPKKPDQAKAVADIVKKLNCETIADMKHEASLLIGPEQEMMRSRISDMEAKCSKKKEDDKKKQDELQKKQLEEQKKKQEELEKKQLEEQKKKDELEKKKQEELLKKQQEEQKRQEELQKQQDEKRRKDAEQQRQREMAEMVAQEKADRDAADAKARADAAAQAAAIESQGRADAAADQELGMWAARVKAKVESVWTLPLGSKTNTAVLRLAVSMNGTITQLSIQSSSGDPVYDDSLMKAMRRADPLPPLPSQNAYRRVLDVGGVALKFTR